MNTLLFLIFAALLFCLLCLTASAAFDYVANGQGTNPTLLGLCVMGLGLVAVLLVEHLI